MIERLEKGRAGPALLFAFTLLMLAPSFGSVAAQTPAYYHVQITSVSYPHDVAVNSTFQVTATVNYYFPASTGAHSTSEWYLATQLYNATRNVSPTRAFLLASSNPNEVSGNGTQIFTLTAKAGAFERNINLTLYAVYQAVPFSYASATGTWTYAPGGPSSINVRVVTAVNVLLAGNLSNVTIPVTVGGVKQYSIDGLHDLDVTLSVHEWHVIAVPETIIVHPDVRALFVRWGDGSSTATRSVYLISDTNLAVIYKLQYFLNVTKNTGSGWYDAGSYANVTAPQEREIKGLLGLLGFKEVFQGWRGDLTSSTTTASVLMDSPHSITAQWALQYRPGRIRMAVLLTVMVSLSVILYQTRRLAIVHRILRVGKKRWKEILSIAVLLALSVVLIRSSHVSLRPGTLLTFLSVNISARTVAFASHAGYPGVFVLMLLEAAAFPIPSEIVLPFAGYLVYRGILSFWPVIFYSTVAAIAGSFIDYYLGLKFARPILTGSWKLPWIDAAHLRRVKSAWDRYGGPAVFLCRLVPAARVLISFPAGAYKMSKAKFAAYTLAGCILWNSILVYLGFLFGSSWSSVTGGFKYFNLAAYALVAILILILVWLTLRKRNRSSPSN